MSNVLLNYHKNILNLTLPAKRARYIAHIMLY